MTSEIDNPKERLSADGGSHVMRRSINSGALWKKGVPQLTNLDIELTERCNNNCIHCNINLAEDDRRAQARELSTDQWRGILKQAADVGVLTLRMTGGEPLLRADFVELYMFARKLGMRVRLFTNARAINPDLVALFKKIPPGEKMEVTVYGLTAASYKAVSRAPGSFDQFWRGVNLLLENGVPFIVKSIILPPNRHEMEKISAWAKSIPWMDKPLGYAMLLELRSRRDDVNKNKIIRKLRLDPQTCLKLIKGDPQKYRDGMVRFAEKFFYVQGDNLFSCGAGEKCSVDAYGVLQPCLSLRHPAFGYNLLQGSLKDALAHGFSDLCKLKAKHPQYLKRCARCFLKSLCDQCPARAWSETGHLDEPVDYLCAFTHAEARELGILEEGEMAWEVADVEKRVAKWLHKQRKNEADGVLEKDLPLDKEN